MSNDLKKKIKVHAIDVNEILFSQYLFSELLSNSCYKINQNGLRDSWFPERCEPRSWKTNCSGYFITSCIRNPQIKKPQNTNNPYSFKTFLGRFFKTCQLSKFKAKSYLAHNCKNQMFFDDQLIILTAYTVSLSYIVTQFWT